MKRLSLPLVLVAFSTLATTEQVSVRIPTFKSAEEAIDYGRSRIAAVDRRDVKSDRQALLEAASAFVAASRLAPTDAKVQSASALYGAEAFLRMDSPASALTALAPVLSDSETYEPLGVQVLERNGEVLELLKAGSGFQTFDRGIDKCGGRCDDRWLALLFLRSGVSKMGAGFLPDAARSLEEAARRLAQGSGRHAFASAALARVQARLGNAEKANAALDASRASAARASTRSQDEPRTFLRDPEGDGLQEYIRETEKELEAARTPDHR